MRPQEKRRIFTKLSALVMILIPTFISVLYYVFIAADQYSVEARFSVRGASSIGSSDLLGLVTGTTGSGSTIADSYILMDYLVSRPMLEKLEAQIDLFETYGSEKADFIAALDPETPMEDVVEYWKKMISISYDTTSQIIVMEVKAFTPKDAELIAEKVLSLGEEMVNNLSEQERTDALRQSNSELILKQAELKKIRRQVRDFRDREKIIDPSKTAEAQFETQAGLEQEIAKAEAELRAKSQYLDESAPSLQMLRTRIASMKSQISQERLKISEEGGLDQQSISQLIQTYRDLLMDQEFAEKAVTSAMVAVEKARLEANSRQRYLVTFVKPSIPEIALYPKRAMNILITFIVSALIWAIGILMFYSVRDHAT
nr:lipopolysaccharide biosynthesis protein [uncultured Cohaesibacter sp.]